MTCNHRDASSPFKGPCPFETCRLTARLGLVGGHVAAIEQGEYGTIAVIRPNVIGSTSVLETSPRAKSEPPDPLPPNTVIGIDSCEHGQRLDEECLECHPPEADPVLKSWNEAALDDVPESVEEKAAAEEARKHVSRCPHGARVGHCVQCRFDERTLDEALRRIAELEAALKTAERETDRLFNLDRAADALVKAIDAEPAVRMFWLFGADAEGRNKIKVDVFRHLVKEPLDVLRVALKGAGR